MRLGRVIPSLALVLVVLALPFRTALAQSDPRAFMTTVGDEVLKIINNKQASEAQRKQQFTGLIENAFDVPRIARFVLGRYWRTASDAEKQQFQQAFETYMISVYWSRFSSYNGQGFKVTNTQNQGGGNVAVRTEITRPESGQPPVNVDWFLRQNGNGYKIEDASLEGVSQAVTYRDEFSSIIERNGGKVSALIDQLNQRAKG
ncbi:MAG: MlaC/ttg2D family ABC transporter substrate-binding protein [Stellaceae bacterium]